MNNFRKTLFIAFLFSIAIHYLMYFTIEKNLKNHTLNINTTNKKNTTTQNGLIKIKYVKVKPVIKEKIEPKPIKEKTKEKAQTKKILNETKKLKKAKKSIPLINLPVVKKEPLDLKKFFTIQKKEIIEQQNQQKKAMERKEEIKEIQSLPEITQSYIKLYGEKYFEFSKNQKKYLKENLNLIGKITQRYLNYPSISIRTKQKGTNVVEFYLHPNGDITDLKLTDSSYYTALDKNTIYTIKLAYKDYPRPVEKVQIKIYVKYILY